MNQLLLAPPPATVQQRIAPPKPAYHVWAMDGKGHSRPRYGPLPTLDNAQGKAALTLRMYPDDFVYIVGWCGHECIGHWHNLFGPNATNPDWRAGDIRDQVRAFIKPAKRKQTRLAPRVRRFQ